LSTTFDYTSLYERDNNLGASSMKKKERDRQGCGKEKVPGQNKE